MSVFHVFVLLLVGSVATILATTAIAALLIKYVDLFCDDNPDYATFCDEDEDEWPWYGS